MALSTSWYSRNVRRLSRKARESSDSTAAAGAGAGIAKKAPGFVGTMKGVAHNNAKVAGGALRVKYPRVPHPPLLWMLDVHAFRKEFSSER